MPRVVAIDYGIKRIGLAISDEKSRMALPLQVVLARSSVEQTIEQILCALIPYGTDITTIVVGIPLLMNGKRGTMAENTQKFINLLQTKTPIPVRTIDERLSTAQAERLLKDSYSRKERSRFIDATAATILLQTYLDQTL